MEKRIYTGTEFELALIELLTKIKNVNTRKDEKELLSGIFKMNGEPYEPATPTAPSMSDEDKVWHAAVQLLPYVMTVRNDGESIINHMTVELAFLLLDEFRRQQKEREGKQ